jgi:hypothetical protein
VTTSSDERVQLSPFPDPEKVTVAVVTGSHSFDVVGFHNLLRSLDGIDAYVQHLEDFVADRGNARANYDAVLLYNFQRETPPEEGQARGWLGRARGVLEELGQTEQGVLVVHHAFNAYPQWEFWSDLVGMVHTDRNSDLERMGARCHFGDIRHVIVDPEHPITRGLSDWVMYGEGWDFGTYRLGPGCQPILRTDFPLMRLKETAWTHQLGKARVFCLQPGHDDKIFDHPNYRMVLERGIKWVARRL